MCNFKPCKSVENLKKHQLASLYCSCQVGTAKRQRRGSRRREIVYELMYVGKKKFTSHLKVQGYIY
jgi:hypothetical protein